MITVRRALSIYREEGLSSLVTAAVGYLRARISGGKSSNPWVETAGGILRPIYNAVFRIRLGPGIDVMVEDWDTLILLDACRYDDFKRINWIEGELSRKISRGADSVQFIKQNFCSRDLNDTVYVTANPHVNLVGDGVFHAVVDDPVEEWDDECRCVPPEKVTETAIEAHRSYPDKRLVVHYMQPHDPPLGATADEVRKNISLGGTSGSEEKSYSSNEDEQIRIMAAVAEGKVDSRVARQAYRETIEIVLDEVELLLRELDGRTVVSSDHGEMFGEYYPLLGELYEHYRHPRTPELCEVPWLVVDGERREITNEPPDKSDSKNDVNVEDQLAALGYK